MGELKGKVVSHLRSAQQWLHRAEQAFDSEKDTRGKLDLMLAQAELQHLHESAIKGKSVPLIRQALAFALAGLLFSGGIGGAYFYLHQGKPLQDKLAQTEERKVPLSRPAPVSPVSQPVPSSPMTVPESASRAVSSAPPVSTAEVVHKETNVAVSSSPAASDKEVSAQQVVKPGEMNKLIRAAGKSLRGQ